MRSPDIDANILEGDVGPNSLDENARFVERSFRAHAPGDEEGEDEEASRGRD